MQHSRKIDPSCFEAMNARREIEARLHRLRPALAIVAVIAGMALAALVLR